MLEADHFCGGECEPASKLFPNDTYQIEDAHRGLYLQASRQANNQKKSPAATAKDRLTESVLNKQTEVRLLSNLNCSSDSKPSCRPACGS